MGRRVKTIVDSINMKIRDSEMVAQIGRGRRDSWRNAIEDDEVFETGKVEKMVRKLKVKSASYRKR